MAEQPFVAAYADRISARPGDRVVVMASADRPRQVQVDLVRLGPGDASGAVREEVVASSGTIGVRPQVTRTGSYMSAPGTARRWPEGPFVAAVLAMPTRTGVASQVLAQSSGGTAWSLGLDEEGRPLARGEGEGGSLQAVGRSALLPGGWYLLAACFDPAGGITVVHEPVGRPAAWRVARSASAVGGVSTAEGRLPLGGLLAAPVLVAGTCAGGTGPRGAYDGKLELPQLLSGPLDGVLLDTLRRGETARERLLVAWDFSRRLSPGGVAGTTVACIGPEGCEGTLWNTPLEAVTGHAWDGSEHDFRAAPAHYGAIHFHVDDLDDCRWDPSAEIELPPGLPSGVYAVRLADPGGPVDRVPLFVRARRPSSALLFLAPTASYLAYANDHPATDSGFSEAIAGATPVLYDDDLLMNEHREWGLSCYDAHLDGEGVSISSRLRPLRNMRPDHRYHVGPWQLAADLALTGWMDDTGIGYDVATDEDLHREGVQLLRPYRAVVTGTHPEYYSTRMLDAMEQYLSAGGRLAHFGANGFYWRVAFDPQRPWVMEVRRGQGGSRPWESPPGEGHLAFSGERGGLWRHLGRPPHKLTAVGYSAQGFDRSGWYRRLPDSYDPRAAFIFDGVPEEVFGTSGAIGGGACGQELDRYDRSLGTPDDALLLATSEGLTESYLRCSEEVLFSLPGTSALCDPKVRADVAYHVKPGGGAVFAAGSIAWAGALGTDEAVARITRNVLTRFADPAPLPW